MKKLILLTLLFNVSLFAQTPPATPAIDPLDNYIDPATQLDYKKQYEKLNQDQQDVLIGRCMMFTIQSEMGQSGEDSMSPSEIEAYENLIESKCKCIQDGFTWKKESTTKGSCDNEVPAEKDLLLYTMDKCVGQMKLTDSNCKANMTDTCVNDFRYQCYQYMTQPLEFSESTNPVLNKCQFDDQTKNIKLECRSYCYVRNTCDVTAEDFKNRKIGNMYLLKKKSRSSCVKGSTYGVNSDNSVWVSNSCHGEFALQYKDPKCGFRPTCTPKPHVIDHIPEGGVQTLEMACNGEENESGGKKFCKVTPFVVDKNGKLTDEPDPNKEVTYVKDLKLVKKIGAAKCNPGGNASAIDYSPRNKGLDGGWGIETMNKCHARFKVTVKWKRKLCTLAGQETTSKDTCCNGLYWDPEAKTCNVIPYNPTDLSDNSLIALEYPGGNQCNPRIPDAVQTLVDKYFVELANYENLFTILDAQSDAISSIEIPKVQTDAADESDTSAATLKLKDSTYDAIKTLHDSIVLFRTDWSNALSQFKTAEEYSKKEYMDYVAYLGKVDKKENTPEDNASVENNMFLGLDLQSAALKNQQYAKTFQLAYIKTIKQVTDQYVFDLEKAAHVGQNVAWYCAHTENCSQRNWLIRDPKKEEIVDFLHDAAYPWKLIEPRGKMLPKISKVNKLMVDNSIYKKFEQGGGTATNQGIMGIPAFKEFFSYQAANKAELPVLDAPGQDSAASSKILELFRKYSHELPLREDSMLAEDALMKEYFDTTKKGSNAAGLPLYCEKQDDYQVRIPIGKAIEPLRMVQVARIIRSYYGLFEEMYKANEACLVDVKANNDSRATDLDVNLGLDSRLIGNNAVKDRGDGSDQGFAKTVNGSLLGQMTSAFGEAAAGSFMDNLFNRNGTSSKLSDSSSAGDFNAIRKKESDRIAKLVKRRIKFKKDKALEGYQKSLDSAFGATLTKKARSFAATNLKGGSGLKGVDGKNKAVGSTDRKGEERKINWGSTSNSGAGYTGFSGSSKGYSPRKSNSYGSGGSNGGSGYGSNSMGQSQDRETEDILANVNDKKFENDESDSLFERVTKRYIRTAYPVLLEKKKVK